jgi:NADH:ubiquinone oxidoreductase subunit C
MSTAAGKIKQSLGGLVNSVEEPSPRRLIAKAEPGNLRNIFVKLLSDFREDFYLDFLAPVDYLDEKQFEVNYALWFYSLKTVLTLRFRLPRDDPTIQTIGDLIPSAVSAEQEAYDLMGVTFKGNDNLRRGFFVDQSVKGFPLRKSEAKQA